MTGEWVKITCQERDAIMVANAGTLCVISGRSDIGGTYGEPCIYSEWGDRATEAPVLRDIRWPDGSYGGEDVKPCEHYRYEVAP